MLNFFTQRLTPREREVLVLVASGASAKEIARQLAITSRTVEAHINHLKIKTRCRNRVHLVAMALKGGLIDNPYHSPTAAPDDSGPLESVGRPGYDPRLIHGGMEP